MIQGVLNDRNNIFLHMYYAPFFLGSSNNNFKILKFSAIDEVTATLPKMFETIFHMKNETLSASESEKVDETPSNLNKDLWNR